MRKSKKHASTQADMVEFGKPPPHAGTGWFLPLRRLWADALDALSMAGLVNFNLQKRCFCVERSTSSRPCSELSGSAGRGLAGLYPDLAWAHSCPLLSMLCASILQICMNSRDSEQLLRTLALKLTRTLQCMWSLAGNREFFWHSFLITCLLPE